MNAWSWRDVSLRRHVVVIRVYGRVMRALLVAILMLLAMAATALVIDERLSKQLDQVDLTWEEVGK